MSELVQIAVSAVAAMEPVRGHAYVQDVSNAAVARSADAYYLTQEAYAALRAKYAAAAAPPVPSPRPVNVQTALAGDLPGGLFFDRVVVINRDCRADRLQRITQWWAEAGMSDHPITRVRAVDGTRLPLPPWWRAGGPAWGCAQSHIRAIEEALVSGTQRLLVLEDDACFAPHFRDRLAHYLPLLPRDWDQFYLGAQYLRYQGRPPWRINQGIRQIYNANRTHAYALSRSGMHVLYRWLTDAPQWRDCGGHYHIDHYLGVGHERAAWSVYGPSRWLCGQGGGVSDLTGHTEAQHFWDLDDEHTALPSAVVVLGPFRSGTSLVGRLLSLLGVFAGKQLKPDAVYNPGGFFEQQDVVDAYWAAFDPRTLEQRGDDAPLVAGLSAVRRAAFAADARLYLVKYAHLVARPDLLASVLGNQRHVFVRRDGPANLRAMRRSWWPDGDDAERIYAAHMSASARLRGAAPSMDIVYEELLADPVTQVGRLAGFLGLPADRSRDARVASVVSPGRPWSAAARARTGDT